MCELFGGGQDVRIEAPPAPPAPAPLSPQELRLRDTQQRLLDQNLTTQERALAEQATTKAALERTLGMPLSDFVAKQASSQAQLGQLVQNLQGDVLTQAKAQRDAFVAATGMTPEEAQAKEAQQQILLFQGVAGQAQSEIARQKAERDAFVAATGITPEQAAAQESARQLTLSQAFGKRFDDALAGNLPVSPGLERSLFEQRQVLSESLRQALGSGWMLSTPGIQAMAEFDERAEELRDNARRGAISEAEQVGYALTPATQRTLAAFQTPVGVPGLTQGVQRAATGPAGAIQSVGAVPSVLQTALPFLQPGYAQTPPQLADLVNQFAGDRNLLNQNALAGYTGQINFQNVLNQARLGAAGAQAQAQGLLGAGLLGTAGTLLARPYSGSGLETLIGAIGRAGGGFFRDPGRDLSGV